jgi:phosphoserine phosphatase
VTARLLLVRHGQSSWNREGRIQGQTDVPLSDEGRRQAEAAARRLRSTTLAGIYSSPLCRAHDTAMAIAQPHALAVTSIPDLAEIQHGMWEGLTLTEIAAKDGERLRQWNETPGRVRMPSGEALRDVRQRSLSAVRVLATRHGGDVICVVSHEIVIKVIVAEVLGMDYDHLMRFAIDNCAVTTVDYDGRVGQVVTLNDMTHLAADR